MPERLTKWLLVAALAMNAVCLWALLGESRSQAQVTSDRNESGLMLVAGQLTHDSYGLWMVDTRNATMCVYQWLPSPENKLRMVAARTFKYDVQLDDWNNAEKNSPRDIKEMVEQHRRLGETTKGP